MSRWRRLLCWVGAHSLRVVSPRHLFVTVDRLRCEHCGAEFLEADSTLIRVKRGAAAW
jgi:hypothetical protein